MHACAHARRYAASAIRVEQLPSTPINMASGDGMLLELPGPKGVPVSYCRL